MDLGLAGKRAVITGGSSGLGLACARALAAESADLILFARTRSSLETSQRELEEEFGVTVTAVTGDISVRGDVLALMDAAASLGGADVLVLNTPRPPSPMRAFVDEDDDERWEAAYRDQLQAALFVLRAAAPNFLARDWGRIVAITSASVKQPMTNHALSTVFRAGVHAALKHLAEELGPRGTTVNAVAPATVVTPTFSTFHNLEARIQGTAVKRPGRPEEIASTVAFLASAHAGFLTGQTIQLDGGQTRSLV